jgi:hypothetical protein
MKHAWELTKIKEELSSVEGYLACEKIIIKHIIWHFNHGSSDMMVQSHLKDLSGHLENLLAENNDNSTYPNYRFVVGFVNSLLKNPLWKNWVYKIEIDL